VLVAAGADKRLTEGPSDGYRHCDASVAARESPFLAGSGCRAVGLKVLSSRDDRFGRCVWDVNAGHGFDSWTGVVI
jgi:hypothetical protein